MKILVIDDKATNREAAKQTIIGHDLTVVGSWDDAVKQLEIRYDDEATKAKLVAAGFPPTSNSLRSIYGKDATEDDKKAWKEWHEAYYKFQAESQIPYWDVVLSDLLMPASRETMGGDGMRFVGQEMPVGLVLALLAAKNGAKYVAVVTATNHHCHPASAMLDRLGSSYWSDELKPNFAINGAKAMFVHHPACYVSGISCPECKGAKYTKERCGSCSIDSVPTGQKVDWQKRAPIPDTVCEGCDGTKQSRCYACNKTGNAEGKHWGMVLAQLVGEEVAQD